MTEPRRPLVERADYSGAVYGSLLAGSVVAGSSPRADPLPAYTLMLVLVVTSLVFWLAHVYTDFVGDRTRGAAWGWAEVRAVGRDEWPLVQATLPPAAVAGMGGVFGLPDGATAWLCLLVAVAGQVGWAMRAAAWAGSSVRNIVVSGVANLLLGLIIIVLKALLTH